MDGKLTTTSTTAAQIATVDTEVERTLATEFVYDPADPYAVTMVIQEPTGPVRWTFGRDLLVEGQYEPTGDGDVQVWPCLSSCGEAVVIVELASSRGEILLQFATRAVQDFVHSTLETVPTGAEAVDVDDWIARLLAD